MGRRPILNPDLRNRIGAIDVRDAQALSRLSVLETDDEEFGAVFKENPAAALAAKGLEVSPDELTNIKRQLERLGPGGGGGNPLATEISVTVKVKF